VPARGTIISSIVVQIRLRHSNYLLIFLAFAVAKRPKVFNCVHRQPRLLVGDSVALRLVIMVIAQHHPTGRLAGATNRNEDSNRKARCQDS
jgi:hypothetical protein